MTRDRKRTPELPTAAEIKTITPIVKREFADHGITIKAIGPHPYGGLIAEACIPCDKLDEMRSALFAHGIILVSAQAGWGFAVLH